MATLQEEDPTAENDSPTEEDTVEELPFETPERKHVDALIDISEEEFLKELEPFEFHCYNGWEEAARGWARVDPMSCILSTPKTHTKAKHGGATPTPLPVNPPTPANPDKLSSAAKHHCEWKPSFQKPTQITQHAASWSNPAVTAPQRDASEWPFLNTLHKTSLKSLHKGKIEQEGVFRDTHHASSKCSVMDNRPCKPQRHSHRPNSTVVPIRNFTFLPPIQPTHFHSHGVSSKKAPEGGTAEENFVLFYTKGLKRETRVDSAAELQMSSAALTSKCRTYQHNPHTFSAVSVSIPRRYQVPLSSKPDTVHPTSYSVGTQALLSSSAASPQAHMNPNKTVCAVRL
ncbi:uncharacterized protein C16orf46 homolog [Halichoeres trimaculatus]|uniref:uncharacterized protein C16orf46 homolog n=1 Tax=Halichoeres trimaculatus TaxID=147232 RepID=UPI003D9E0632